MRKTDVQIIVIVFQLIFFFYNFISDVDDIIIIFLGIAFPIIVISIGTIDEKRKGGRK